MDFRILGPLDVRDGDQVVELAGGRRRALLALLIVHANETVSTDRIVEELWGEHSPPTAPKVIQNHVSQLRRALGDGLLVTESSGYRLRMEPGKLDLDRFEELLAEGRSALDRGDGEAAARLLRESLALWRGSPLADVALEPFAQSEIVRLEERRLVALEERIDADLALRRHADLVGELEALAAKNPLRERLRAQLMLALYRSGRQSEALAAYQDARRALVDELGIEPGRSLRELQQAILNQDPGLDPARAAALPVTAAAGAFVGRERELGELRAGLDDAFSGRGRLFLLAGEPGVGKTRLAEELMAEARARGAETLIGRCWEAGGAPAYWPWVQSLRTLVREMDGKELRRHLGPGASDLTQIFPELRERFPELVEPPALESEAARFSLFDAMAEFLGSASGARPIVLFLDDLHAADASSLLLLQFVSRELGSTRILVLGAYRDVDPIPGETLAEFLSSVVGEPVTHSLPVGGLSEHEVAEYLELTSSEIASGSLVTALLEETEGNPLFLTETVRLLAIEGVEPETAGKRIVIPPSVQGVIARRLTHLSDECNRVLRLAAVLGREFSLPVLARLAALSEEGLLDILDEAMAARVVSDVPGASARLRFAHVLIRDTLYEALTTAGRVRLHRQAIVALEALHGEEPGPHLDELAFHSIAGSDFERALRYSRRAGDHALLALLAYEEAARLYRSALEALDLTVGPDEGVRCELLLALGEAEARAGNRSDAQATFLDAAALARRLGRSRELGRAALGYGGRISWARVAGDERLVPLLEEGLASLPAEEVELRARLLARLAGALRDEHSRDRRDALTEEAVELARRTGSPVALAYALDGRAGAIIAPDTIGECLELAAELCAVAERLGDGEQLIQGHDTSGIAHSMAGCMARAAEHFETGRQIAQELGQPDRVWQTLSTVAAMALAEGKLAVGEELAQEAFELGRHAQPEMAIPVYQFQRFTLAEHRGTLAEVEPAIRALVD